MNKKLIITLTAALKELDEREDIIGRERNAAATLSTAIALLTEAEAERAERQPKPKAPAKPATPQPSPLNPQPAS